MLNIKLRVRNLVRKYDTSNPYELARHLKIDVYEFKLPRDVRGFIIHPLRRKMIFLNDSLSETEKIVALSHELGHVRLHSGYGYTLKANTPYYRSSRREAEANEFAAHLLSYRHDINADMLQQVLNQKRPEPLLVHKMLNEIINSQEM